MKTLISSLSIVLLAAMLVCSLPGQQKAKPFLPFGIFLASVEEGARIFTPVRLLPFDHPESMGHQFPNALQLFGTEFQTIIWLGQQSGYQFGTTLHRYPMEPSPDWPYPEFSQLPDSNALRSAPPVRRPKSDAPLKGLRAVLFVNREPVGFVVDTRGLTLEERGMKRATSMGLDLSRAEFLAALSKAAVFLKSRDTCSVIFAL